MRRSIIAIGCVVLLIVTAGCSKKESTSAPAGGASAAASQAPLPVKTAVMINFNDVSVSTAGPPILRLGFSIRNISKDPVTCDASEFTIQLPDGSTVSADESAENKCDPDLLDPGTTGKVTVFFNLPTSSPGTITMSMMANNAIIGRQSTTVK